MWLRPGPPSADGDAANLAVSWRRALAAESKSPATAQRRKSLDTGRGPVRGADPEPTGSAAWDLQDNSLCRITAVQDRASHSYRGRPGAEALALRDLVEAAVSLASDLLAPPYETFLRRWVATENVAAVTREMGRDRSHLSRAYRPRVVMVVTDVFMKLTGSGDHRDANTRPRRSLRSR